MRQIVIDANVFAHALNPGNEFFDSALKIVRDLLDNDLVLALDDTGKASPSEWTSNLYREYTECLPPSLSMEVITFLILRGRVSFHARPARQTWMKCKKLAPRNSNDATVLGIGVQTDRHEIVSNDYNDFNTRVRGLAAKELGVTITDTDNFRVS